MILNSRLKFCMQWMATWHENGLEYPSRLRDLTSSRLSRCLTANGDTYTVGNNLWSCDTQKKWQHTLHKALGLKFSLVCRNIWVTSSMADCRSYKTQTYYLTFDVLLICSCTWCTIGLYEGLSVFLSPTNATTLTTHYWISRLKITVRYEASQSGMGAWELERNGISWDRV